MWFGEAARARFAGAVEPGTHVLIDARVAELHEATIAPLLSATSVQLIDATEDQKSMERMPVFMSRLLEARVRRGHRLLAVGGGIVQDIVCFIAATLLRGIEWRFIPTTLLAQADSCIGSKSSINVGKTKNAVGTYTPPGEICVWPDFLDTLDGRDVRSGIGEMLKVHAIDGPESFSRIAGDYELLTTDRAVLLEYIRRSLGIKRELIELDEFDRGLRNVLNYGHSFGHAIESATGFAIPHGIAITIGMDMANFVAACLGTASRGPFERMHPTLQRNFAGYERREIPLGRLLDALGTDKKNTDAGLRVVLPDAHGRIHVVDQRPDERFMTACAEYLATGRLA